MFDDQAFSKAAFFVKSFLFAEEELPVTASPSGYWRYPTPLKPRVRRNDDEEVLVLML